MKHISIDQVRTSQNLENASIPVIMRYIFVPLAWPITSVFATFGVSPNAATTIRFGLILVSTYLLLSGAVALFFYGVGTYIFAVILDSVDGNLSRLQDKASYLGKYLDGIVDIIGELLFHTALIFYFKDHLLNSPLTTFIVLMGALSMGLSFVLVHRLPLFLMSLPQPVSEASPPYPVLTKFLKDTFIGRGIIAFDAELFNVIFDIKFLMLVFYILKDEMHHFVISMSYVYIVFTLMFFTSRTLRAYECLDHYRVSRSAGVNNEESHEQ